MVTPKPWHKRRHDADQVPTSPVTVEWIMRQPTFLLGVADARANRSYHCHYDHWDTNGQWNYERGRMWGVVVPRSVPLKSSGKIAPEAIAWFHRVNNDVI